MHFNRVVNLLAKNVRIKFIGMMYVLFNQFKARTIIQQIWQIAGVDFRGNV